LCLGALGSPELSLAINAGGIVAAS
jgi:hypothetical protein